MSVDDNNTNPSQVNLTKKAEPKEPTLEQLADVFQVLSHETRLRILLAVAAADSITMTVLADTIGLTIPRTSELVTQLERGGFCKKTKLSNYVAVSLCFEGVDTINLFLNGLKLLQERNQQS